MLCWAVCCLVWLISALDESCSELPPVDNSVLVAKEVEGQLLGDYLCIKGYHLVGKQSLVLNISEELDVSPAECRLGHCPEPVLENGTTNYSGPVSAGDKIMFKCIDGYILKGSNWSQCQEDHTWAPSLPICRSMGTQKLQCVDGEWNSSYPTCEPAPRPADQIALEKAILAFQESKDLCNATENFVRRLKESGLTMEELKYSLEMKKIKLKEDFLLKYHS
ncbi:hypothetical protein U0070_020783 [Myodes glareolus]|uniref:Sushi domain-containing protein n=1 Tax=Myodes glareolus TaxID=447135 RepID=A0AAW0IEC1_MYOGA